MSDIVELLQTRLNTPFRITELMNAAADEIEHLMRAHDDMSDTIETLRARVAELEEALADPGKVHINMLRGTIAKPTLAQIIHLYGENALRAALKEGEGNG